MDHCECVCAVNHVVAASVLVCDCCYCTGYYMKTGAPTQTDHIDEIVGTTKYWYQCGEQANNYLLIFFKIYKSGNTTLVIVPHTSLNLHNFVTYLYYTLVKNIVGRQDTREKKKIMVTING
ncbi:hypothetical protein B566_EDAN015885 [Ephemera danica]|nr:hypothetical protein B566_EDAN015885 [Ephemera danica]